LTKKVKFDEWVCVGEIFEADFVE